ncbi:MAG: ribose-5-phosphate isomerase RpiA [Methylomonas sp.]|nr:ribose-5-phosphate isomerase RpiA [Methylomonas sp.]PPD20705.1 MAG: ribose 5-phosphate isomerase A [Methylomonas sp.]PPD25056.1 MAG: ribose 5-phosphate isomerase A [Methylomonas sp.]PPD34372.1 MAG: ribose 5-phosphate isomerase A [Methylomonas sp.]PPD38956.1 MAG: ribose 5-phosphate isomerase A [Methylomonas sp.]
MNDKQRVAEHAAQRIKDGMIVGLGTGSTANFFIEALARRMYDERLKLWAVASSVVSTIKAREVGLPLIGIEQVEYLDVYVDGADEVAPDLTLLKGRGADLVREKLLAKASKAFWVLIDRSKQVEYIGQKFPIPIEVMPFAWSLVNNSLMAIGGTPQLRANGDGLFVTSHGSLVVDTLFEPAIDGKTLNKLLNDIPGIVEHGVFCDLATAIFCGHDGRVDERWAFSGGTE